MKKIAVLAVALISVLTLCACGAPQDCNIGAMKFQISNDYTKIEDRSEANENYNDAIGVSSGEDSDSMTAEDYLDVQWYEGSEYSLSVTAMYASYRNSEFDKAAEEILGDDNGKYTKFQTGSANGRCGTYKIKSAINYEIDVLNGGILYAFTFYNAEDISEDEISGIVDSIDFDKSLLKKHNVECGDYSLKISGEYQPLSTDDFDEDIYHDISAFGKFGKTRVDFTINYFDKGSYKSAHEIAEVMKQDITNVDYSELAEDFGKCCYLSGRGSDDMYDALAFFEKDDKVYMIALFSEDQELTIDDVKAITKTIKEK